MPPKGESVQTYVSPEIKRKLEEWAAEEQRSISFLVAQILIDAIATREAENKPSASGTSKGKGGGKKGG
jgi:predicted transcriptional regulator